MNLRWFRKHQKGMLVVFGVILMAVFGLGGVVSMIDPSRSMTDPEGNKVVVKWKGGKYTRRQLQGLLKLHFQTLQFIYTIDGIKAKEQGMNFARSVRLIDPIQTNISPESTDYQLMSRLMLAEKAKELGIEIGDSEVDAYIQSLSLDPMSEQDMKYTNQEVNKGDISLKAIKRHLKMELLSQRMEQFLGLSLYPSPSPTEAADIYVKMNRQIECQIIGFPVKDYLNKVTGTPTNDELKSLFAEGEKDYPSATNSKPGFKKPRELVVGYFVADYETFLNNEKAKVTPEELQAEYDKWVKDKHPKVIEKIEDKPKTDGNELKLPGEEDPDGSDAPKPKSGDGKTGSDKKSTEKPKTSENKTENKKTESDKKSEDKKSDDKKQNEQASVADEPEILTSRQDKAGKQDSDSKKQDSDSKQDNKKQDTEKSDTEKSETQEKKGDPAPKPPGKQETGGAGKTGENKKQATPEEKTRIKTLDEVADDIKESLKAADARTALNEAIKLAEDELLIYLELYETWKNVEKEEGNPPALPNFKALANKLGLEYKSTGTVTDASIFDTELGKIETVRFSRGPNNQIQPNFQKLGGEIFQNYYDLRLFDAKKSDDFRTRKQYLYWVSDKRDPEVLSFEDAKPMIVKYWKFQRARELAKAAAAKFAKTVETRKVPMKSVDAEKAQETGAFQWYIMNQNGRIDFGSPKNVEDPGDEFMEQAFSLEELDTGVAPNSTNEVYYAIQLTKKVATTDNMTQPRLFMNQLITFQRLSPGMTQVNAQNTRKSNLAWLREFEKEMGVEWLEY